MWGGQRLATHYRTASGEPRCGPWLCERPPVKGFPLRKDASEHVTGIGPIAAPGADAHSASFIAEPVREVPQLDAAGESRGCAEFHQLPVSCYVGTGLG